MANELMNTFDSGTDIVTRASFNSRIEQANTNFVDGLGEKAEVETLTGTLLSTGWAGSSAPYSQTITVTGMASTDEPIADVTFSGVYLDDISIASAWSKVYDLETSTNQVTFYADEIPSVNVTVRMKVVR